VSRMVLVRNEKTHIHEKSFPGSKLISRPGTPLVLVNHFDCVSDSAV
jgi:hypothetical protein